MFKNRFLLMLYLVSSLSGTLPAVWCEDNPAADFPQTEPVLAQNYERYTLESFALLSDEEKRTVYFDTPWLLPENIDLQIYFSIFHPETADTNSGEEDSSL